MGSHEPVGSGQCAVRSNPFPAEKVKTHLAEAMEALVRISIQRANSNTCDALYWATLAATAELVSLAGKFTSEPNARELEENLTTVERDLDKASEESATAAQVAEARAAAEAMFRPYQNSMLPQVYEQQIDSALKNNLRKAFGVPRLSLFHMK